jgi:hypothetical protein
MVLRLPLVVGLTAPPRCLLPHTLSLRAGECGVNPKILVACPA